MLKQMSLSSHDSTIEQFRTYCEQVVRDQTRAYDMHDFRREVERMLDVVDRVDESDRTAVLLQMGTWGRGVIGGVALSGAQMALNTNDADWLSYGLRGNALLDYVDDWRDGLRNLALLQDAADRLDVDLAQQFDAIDVQISDATRDRIRTALGEPFAGLASMDYALETSDDGWMIYREVA